MEDFRSAALNATRKELGVGSADALRAGTRSGVIDLPESLRHSLMPARLLIIALLVLMVFPILTMGLGFAGRLPGVAVRMQGIVGFLSLALIGLMWVGIVVAERLTMARIGRRRPPAARFGYSEVVAIEPANTYDQLKILADDLGVLHHDLAAGRLIIEGAQHCYVICASDVAMLVTAAFQVGSGVHMEVRVGSAVLSVVLSSRQKPSAPSGRTAESERAAFRQRIAETLGIAIVTEQQTGFDVLPPARDEPVS